MFYSETVIERSGSGSLLPAIVRRESPRASIEDRARYAAERALDEALAESFPASDPPSWTMGVARRAALDPGAGAAAAGVAVRTMIDAAPVNRDVIDVSVPPDRRGLLRRAVVGSMGAAGIALLVPVVILLAGLPVVLVARAVVEVLGRLAAGIVR